MKDKKKTILVGYNNLLVSKDNDKIQEKLLARFRVENAFLFRRMLDSDIFFSTDGSAFYTVLRNILKAVGAECNINQFTDEYRKILKEETVIRTDMIEAVLKLKEKGYDVCLFANMNYFDKKYFDEVTDHVFEGDRYISCETGFKVPTPEAFAFAKSEKNVVQFIDAACHNCEVALDLGVMASWLLHTDYEMIPSITEHKEEIA